MNFATPPDPFFVGLGDFNNDGKADLITANVGNFSGRCNCVAILLGNGDGTFGPEIYFPDGGLVRTVAGGDFNGDHQPDVVVSDDGAGQIITVLNTGVVTFSPTTPSAFISKRWEPPAPR